MQYDISTNKVFSLVKFPIDSGIGSVKPKLDKSLFIFFNKRKQCLLFNFMFIYFYFFFFFFIYLFFKKKKNKEIKWYKKKNKK